MLTDTSKFARDHLVGYQKVYKDRYDAGACRRYFNIGDWVRVRLHVPDPKLGSKCSALWSRPRRVTAIEGVNLRLFDPDANRTLYEHFDHCRRVTTDKVEADRQPLPPANTEFRLFNDDDEHLDFESDNRGRDDTKSTTNPTSTSRDDLKNGKIQQQEINFKVKTHPN